MTTDVVEQFRHAIQGSGMAPPDVITPDGKLHRFSSSGERGDDAGWYVLHGDGIPKGVFGDWRAGIKRTWCADTGRVPTAAEIETLRQKAVSARQRREEIERERHAEARQCAATILQAATGNVAIHPYAVLKRVDLGPHVKRGPWPQRAWEDALLVPVYDVHGVVQSIEAINVDGSKDFLIGGKRRSGFLPFGEIRGAATVLIGEGVATVAACAAATGLPAVAAMGAANLSHVATIVRIVAPEAAIVLLADNDVRDDGTSNTGLEAARSAAATVGGRVAVPELGGRKCDFWDIWSELGPEAVADVLRGVVSHDVAVTQSEKEDRARKAKAPPKEAGTNTFVAGENGVFYRDDDGGAHWICSPLRVTALVRDTVSENWGRLLEFEDPDGRTHQWSMPMEMLRGSGEDLRGELLRMGLSIAPGTKARNKLTEFITTTKPAARARCVTRTGWHNRVFVFPDHTIGARDERVLYQAAYAGRNYARVGTLDAWRERVASLCSGNSRLLVAVSASFAAMLLEPAGAESGGLHLVGESSAGKTTALRVAASVYGGAEYLNRWRATTNGVEALAALHSDTLLILDEIAQIDAREAGDIAYMLANGSGKARADRTGGARARQSWRLLFLSAGEIGLSQHMREAGKKTRAGQEVRLIDLPADAGAGLGLFDTLHGRENGARLSRDLAEASGECYGTAAPAFLSAIVGNLPALQRWIIAQSKAFTDQHLPAEASGQAHRVSERFALIGMAGELATAKGITGWRKGEAIDAAARLYREWLESRGGAGNQERAAMLASVRGFLEQHGEARFTDLDDPDARDTINRAGFRRRSVDGTGTEHLVLPEAFRREVCAGFEPRAVTRVLLDAGWLEPDADGKPQKRERLPGMRRTRCYVLTPAIWEA